MLHKTTNLINLMVYLSYPEEGEEKGFDKRQGSFIKMQIDNLLRIGWPKSRILLCTNFNYEYNGIKSTIIPDNLIYFQNSRRRSLMATKPDALLYILKNLIKKTQIVLFHDQDAHQNHDKLHLPVEVLDHDMCLTSYNYDPVKINTGVWFLKPTKNTFTILTDISNTQKRLGKLYDEDRLSEIMEQKKYKNICILGHEWNFGKHSIKDTLRRIGYRKPVFCHFSMDNYNDFCTKNSVFGEPLANPELIKIIDKHRVD